MNVWEVWFALFPYEENPDVLKPRPVIVLDTQTFEVLSTKVTSHNERDEDPYDVPILHWKESGLKHKSVARVAKTIQLDKDKFKYKIGTLKEEDQKRIEEAYIKFISNQ